MHDSTANHPTIDASSFNHCFFLALGVLALILAMRIGIFHQTQLALLVEKDMPVQLQQQRRKQTAILALLLAVLFFVLAYII